MAFVKKKKGIYCGSREVVLRYFRNIKIVGFIFYSTVIYNYS